MIQGFLLDGVDAKAAGAPVRREQHLVVTVGAHETQPTLTGMQLAESRAEVALQATVVEAVPVTGRLAR